MARSEKRRLRMDLVLLSIVVIVSLVLLMLYADMIRSPSHSQNDGELVLIIDFDGREPDTWPHKSMQWVDMNGSLVLQENTVSIRSKYLIDSLSFESTPFDLLELVCEKLGIGLGYEHYINGVFVNNIDGVSNGPGDAGWTYYINEEPSTGTLIPFAADVYHLNPGDTVYWYFSE